MKEQRLFVKTVGETLELHGDKLIQIYAEMNDLDNAIEKLKLVIQQHTLELHEIHLSLESLEERFND